MKQERRELWKACVGVLLFSMLFLGYWHYPDYDTPQKRAALLSSEAGSAVGIVDEVIVGEHTVCQLRTETGVGSALFQDMVGKTVFHQFHTTNGDRMVFPVEIGSEMMLVLICDQPRVHHAVLHFYDGSTYTALEPINMEGRQMLVVPHRPELGSYGYTEYYDADGNLL